jgi:hypothetical protein
LNVTYITVDKHGKTVDFLLRPDRSIAAAQAPRDSTRRAQSLPDSELGVRADDSAMPAYVSKSAMARFPLPLHRSILQRLVRLANSYG